MDACGNTCTDPQNCGGCGNVCITGASCDGGVCECPSGDIVCNGACVDGQMDAGACAQTEQGDGGSTTRPLDATALDGPTPIDATTPVVDAVMSCVASHKFSCGTTMCSAPDEICGENLWDAGHGPTWTCSPTPTACECIPSCGCVEAQPPYSLETPVSCQSNDGEVTLVTDVQGIQQ